jgi:hypothetical protein
MLVCGTIGAPLSLAELETKCMNVEMCQSQGLQVCEGDTSS